MTPHRKAFLVAAESAARLLADPAVAAAWTAPSALTGFTVGGLAAHLAVQVLFVPKTLADPPPPGEVVPLAGHYTRAAWVGADLEADANVQIRRGGEESAVDGPAAVAAGTVAAVHEIRTLLAAAPPDRLVHPPAGPWALRLDDFLTTRMMEIAVHSDDLAYSVGIPTPDLPPDVLDPVLALLSGLAVRRHGQAAVLRALTRAERAPTSIAAF
jgi:hypothetical protein